MQKGFIFIIVLLGFVSFISSAFALEIGGKEVEIILSDTYVTRYIWRGQDLFGDNDGAHQPSIDITFPKLFYDTDLSLNLWGSFPLSDGHEDAEELDFTVTFSRDILDEIFNISLGSTYYAYPNTVNTANISEPWGALTLNKIPFLPIDVSATVFAGYDFEAHHGGADEGWYYSWSLDTEIPLSRLAFSQKDQKLDIGVINWGNDGVADLKPSTLYATEVYLLTAYTLNNFNFVPSVHYVISHEDEINNGDNEVWFSLSMGYTF